MPERINPRPKWLQWMREAKRIGHSFLRGDKLVPIDYPIEPGPRYGHGKPPQPKMYELLSMNKKNYERILEEFAANCSDLRSVPYSAKENSPEPRWKNHYLSGLDAIALHGFIKKYRPKTFFEIGSGNSTKFAKRAIQLLGLNTRVVSIDPNPRAEIDAICNEIIRQPLEQTPLDRIESLKPNDILFYDGSHRTYMNSDATVFFVDIIPRIPPGVIIQIHDIFLPYDYPPEWQDRYYSEQYLLACYLLAEGYKLEILLPNYFVTEDPEMQPLTDPIWQALPHSSHYRSGVSFWLLKRSL